MGDWDLESDAQGVRPAKRTASAAPDAPPAPAPAVPRDPWSVQPPPRRPLWERISLVWTGAVVAVLLVGLLAGFFIGRSQYSGDSAAAAQANARVSELQFALSRSEDRNWTYYRTIEGLKGELEQARSTLTTVPAPDGIRDSYSDGVYLVGEDIPAGTYDGVVTGTLGYWARLKGTDGAIASIIENAIPKGPFVLTIAPADKAVELRGVTLTPR